MSSNSAPPDWLVFEVSSIHGRGAFARLRIPRDTEIIEYRGRRIPKSESLVLCEADNPFIFSIDEHHDIDGSVEWNPARFINHSCAPNCDAIQIEDRIWIIARRDIERGEEITYNYGYDLDEYRDYPCRCGAAACVGFIVAEELAPLVRRRRGLLES